MPRQVTPPNLVPKLDGRGDGLRSGYEIFIRKLSRYKHTVQDRQRSSKLQGDKNEEEETSETIEDKEEEMITEPEGIWKSNAIDKGI